MFATFGWKKQREVELVAEAITTDPSELHSSAAESSSLTAVASGPASSQQAEDGCWAVDSSERAGCSTPSGMAEPASVRQKAQYFEALIRSNTDTLIRCASCQVTSSGRCCDMDLGSDDGSSDAEHWQGDYSEVQLVLRMPKQSRPPPPQQPDSGSSSSSHPQYGSVDEMAVLIERLQAQLQVKDREKALTASALSRKTQECDNLMRVVRELADSRAKVVSSKASLQEKYIELQSEYHRMLRIAELSRTVSKQNLAKTSRTQKALRQTEDELHSTRKQAAQIQSKSKKLKTENCELKEKLSLLERLDVFDGVQESACMREFTRYRVCETY